MVNLVERAGAILSLFGIVNSPIHTIEGNLHTITYPERNTIIWATVDCEEDSVLLEWQRPNLEEGELDSLGIRYYLEVNGRRVPRIQILSMHSPGVNLIKTRIPTGPVMFENDPIGVSEWRLTRSSPLPGTFDFSCVPELSTPGVDYVPT